MIEQILSYDLSLFSLILLIILFVITKIKKDVISFSSTLFHWIIIVNIIGLTAEVASWIFDNKPGYFNYLMSYTSNVLVFLMAPIIIGLWASYLDYKLFSNKKRIYNRYFYMFPAFITLIILLFNLRYPLYFSIDQQTNVYTSGGLLPLQYIFVYSLYLYIIILVVQNRKHKDSTIITGIMLFLMFPLIGSTIQMFFNTLLFTWSSLSISLMVVYIFMETTSGSLDYLTKLYTRKILETYMKSLIEDKKEFYVVMIDLDRFKEVNDLFGHSIGDRVLIDFAKIIKDVKQNYQMFASRLGGDEFLLVLQHDSDDIPKKLLDEMNQRVNSHPYISKFKFLSFSAGYVKYDHKMNMDDLLLSVDQKMYEKKVIRKFNQKHIYDSDY
ncbi:MAG: GGDEF domain-containing protein [Firmicutes bacterium]|nr:GGDEF domain-containing protein [Bacillota bacterium]